MTSKNKEPEPEAAPADGVPVALKFEDAIERLEEIVRRMEEEQMPLAELISDYETGTRLLRVCRDRIETARARIEQIGQVSGDGAIVLEDFGPVGEEAPASQGGKNVRLL